MGRRLSPEFVQEIRRLGMEGYTQVEIAAKLNTSQARISQIMRSYDITREHYGTQRRNRISAVSGGLQATVQLRAGGKLIRTEMNATPDQLRALATYMEGLRDQAMEILKEQQEAYQNMPDSIRQSGVLAQQEAKSAAVMQQLQQLKPEKIIPPE